MRGIMKFCLPKNSRLLVACLLLWGTAAAQREKETIYITTAATDITSLAKNISAQTGLKYSLNMQNASLKKKITLKPGNYTLAQVLEQVKKQANLQYKILGTHILFVDYSAGNAAVKAAPGTTAKQTLQAPPKAATRTIVKKVQTAPQHLVKPHRSAAAVKVQPPQQKRLPVINGGIIPASEKQRIITADNSSAFSIAAWLKGRDKLLPQAAIMPAKKAAVAGTAPVPPAAAAAKQPYNKRAWWKPMLKAGVAADELLYGGAHVQAGLHWVYGIALWGTNFSNSQFRWGAGLSLPLGATQRIQLNFTTGTSAAYYAEDSAYREVWEKEKLHRLGIAWSKDIGNRLSMQVQVHYNLLHQSFTAARDTGTIDIKNPLTGDFDQRYRVFTPPYTIRKSTGANTADKSWLGIQLSLFYRFL